METQAKHTAGPIELSIDRVRALNAYIDRLENSNSALTEIAREALAVIEHGGGSFAVGPKGRNHGIEDKIRAALALAGGLE